MTVWCFLFVIYKISRSSCCFW